MAYFHTDVLDGMLVVKLTVDKGSFIVDIWDGLEETNFTGNDQKALLQTADIASANSKIKDLLKRLETVKGPSNTDFCCVLSIKV